MKNTILAFLLVLTSFWAFSQDAGISGFFDPNTVEVGLNSTLEVHIGTGSTAIPSGFLTVAISFPPSLDYTNDGVTPPAGADAGKFTWAYVPSEKAWAGLSNQVLAAQGDYVFTLVVTGAIVTPLTGTESGLFLNFAGDINSNNDNASPSLKVVAAMPIVISSFNAKSNECGKAELNWSTESERNSEKVVVERKLSTEKTFSAVGEVPSAANSNHRLNYNFEDNIPAAFVKGSVYYRLRQVDLDGLYGFSDVIELSYECDQLDVVNIYPNPGVKDINLEFPNHWEGQDIEVEFFNEQNRLVKSETIENFNISRVNIDIQNLPAGVYYIKIRNNDVVLNKKFIRMQ